MQSYSEIECVFVVEELYIEEFLRVCSLFQEKGFELNCQSPGYVCGEDFEYPEWTTLKQACEQVKKGSYESWGINFCFLESDGISFNKLSLEADFETKSISLKTGEEVFIDKDLKKIKRSKLLEFAGLSKELSRLISAKAWKIAQTGFDYDLGSGANFISYAEGRDYFMSDLDDTISWYENEYLTRWQ